MSGSIRDAARDARWNSALAQFDYGVRVQARVVHALLLREITTRFGRNQLGFLWLLLEPLTLASAIGILHWFLAGRHGGDGLKSGVPIFLFYVVGYAPYFAFRSIVNRAPTAFQANMTLMYHRQVRPLDVMLARNILEVAAVTGALVLLIGGSAWVINTVPDSIPTMAAALAMMFALANGLAMMAAAAAARWEVVDRLIHPLTYLSLPFSGAFIPLHALPPSWRELMLWNPQPNLHEMLREGMFGHLIVSHYDVGYVMAWVLCLNLFGLAALRAVRVKMEF